MYRGKRPKLLATVRLPPLVCRCGAGRGLDRRAGRWSGVSAHNPVISTAGGNRLHPNHSRAVRCESCSPTYLSCPFWIIPQPIEFQWTSDARLLHKSFLRAAGGAGTERAWRQYPKAAEIKGQMGTRRARARISPERREINHLRDYSKVGPNRYSTTGFRGVGVDGK